MTGIERFRRKSLLSQAQLAAMLDVTSTSVSNWESGKATPRVEMYRQMSLIFRVPVDDLLRNDYPENDVAGDPRMEGPSCSPASS